MERKELEHVKSASLEPSLDLLVRKTVWAIHCCGTVPELLDAIQFEFIDRAREKSSDIKKLFVPDCTEK